MEDFFDIQKYKEFLDFKSKEELIRDAEINKRKPITDWCKHYALFYDAQGKLVGKKKLRFKERTFNYTGGAYNFLPEKASYFKHGGFLSSAKYYFYTLNNPMPLVINKTIEPVLDSEVYKSILDSDLVKKLNPKKFNLLDMIGGWKGLIIMLIAGIIIYFFVNGGKLN